MALSIIHISLLAFSIIIVSICPNQFTFSFQIILNMLHIKTEYLFTFENQNKIPVSFFTVLYLRHHKYKGLKKYIRNDREFTLRD